MITHPRLIAHLNPSRITHPTVLRSYSTFFRLYPETLISNPFSHDPRGKQRVSHNELLFSPQCFGMVQLGVVLAADSESGWFVPSSTQGVGTGS